MANQTWCGNFRLITDNEEIIERLQLFSDMLLKHDNNILSYNLDETIILLDEKDKPIKTNIYTFLFFHDYFNYWKMFSNFNKVSSFLVFSDLFSRDNYLEFDNIPESKDKFFNELLLFFNTNIFKEEYLNDHKLYKNLFTSIAFSEMFKYAKNKIIIPCEYEDILLENIFKENIIQYKNQTFKKIFNEISVDKKMNFLIKKIY